MTSSPSRTLVVLVGAYSLVAVALLTGALGGVAGPPESREIFNSPLEAALTGALGGLVGYLLSFSSAGVLGLVYASSLSGMSRGSTLIDLLVRGSLLAPAVFGFSDFASVCLAWRYGYAKSARSVLKFTGYAVVMGAAAALALPPRCSTAAWWAVRLDSLAAGTSVLAIPAWAYLRSGERTMRGTGLALATSAAALLVSSTSGALGALAGAFSGAIPWLIPRRLFFRKVVEIPPPPVGPRVQRSVADDIAEVRRLILERMAEGGL